MGNRAIHAVQISLGSISVLSRVITLHRGGAKFHRRAKQNEHGLPRAFFECLAAALPSSAGQMNQLTLSKSIAATWLRRWLSTKPRSI